MFPSNERLPNRESVVTAPMPFSSCAPSVEEITTLLRPSSMFRSPSFIGRIQLTTPAERIFHNPQRRKSTPPEKYCICCSSPSLNTVLKSLCTKNGRMIAPITASTGLLRSGLSVHSASSSSSQDVSTISGIQNSKRFMNSRLSAPSSVEPPQVSAQFCPPESIVNNVGCVVLATDSPVTTPMPIQVAPSSSESQNCLSVITLPAPIDGVTVTNSGPIVSSAQFTTSASLSRDKNRSPSVQTISSTNFFNHCNTSLSLNLRLPNLPVVGNHLSSATNPSYSASAHTSQSQSRIRKTSRQTMSSNPKIFIERTKEAHEDGFVNKYNNNMEENTAFMKTKSSSQLFLTNSVNPSINDEITQPSDCSFTEMEHEYSLLADQLLLCNGAGIEEFMNEKQSTSIADFINVMDPNDPIFSDKRGGALNRKVTYPEVGRPSFPYTEPISDGSASFLQRLHELSSLETETVRWEKARASKRIAKGR